MKVSPQPRVSVLLRVFAGTFACLWIVGISACGMERAYICAGHQEACTGYPTTAPDHDPVVGAEQEHAEDAECHHDGVAQHEHGGNDKKGCDEKICCTTMMALLPTANPIVIANSISQQVCFAYLLNAGPEHALTDPNYDAVRQAKPRDWVFTPEVCLGAAHCSHAPPSLT